jgi:hypothetical protein
MARRIDISTCSNIQSGKIISLPVSITDNGVPVSSFEYVFAAERFSVAYDTINTMIATLHLGDCNSLTISNGNFDEFYYAGVAQLNPVALVGQVVQDVAVYAFV